MALFLSGDTVYMKALYLDMRAFLFSVRYRSTETIWFYEFIGNFNSPVSLSLIFSSIMSYKYKEWKCTFSLFVCRAMCQGDESIVFILDV